MQKNSAHLGPFQSQIKTVCTIFSSCLSMIWLVVVSGWSKPEWREDRGLSGFTGPGHTTPWHTSKWKFMREKKSKQEQIKFWFYLSWINYPITFSWSSIWNLSIFRVDLSELFGCCSRGTSKNPIRLAGYLV